SKYLSSPQPQWRVLGMVASSLHRVDPGLTSARRLEDPDPAVRARALRCAGELGQYELVSRLAGSLDDGDVACRFWAAWSGVLTGDRLAALESLKASAQLPGPFQQRAHQTAILAMSPADAHALLQQIARDPGNVRRLIQGAGWCGDPAHVPWLIGQMSNEALARLAAEAFSTITGVDLEALDMEGRTPESAAAGPGDDPEDANVDMDPDESLPWPDQAKIQAWWDQNGARFTTGVRHFMGAPPSRAHCIDVLKNGYQRQRIAAAYHLCLLNPGTPLFEWRAPAWRQQRELAQMS
ncbi:MAG TPA: TIGR02270 family protein, partial [Povalibacter sp.]|nr:TIGR02270 family protein [Povalibacter sp.]